MDLRRIIKEELDNQEFQGIIDMVKSKQLGSIALALQIAEANKADKQFEDYYKISLKKYSEVFNEIILPMSGDADLIFELKNLLTHNLDLDKLYGGSISSIIISQPQLADKFNLKKLNTDTIDYILRYQPQLKPYFDKLK